ncbi:hypothetical protein G9A89_006181 [Geosiphon pyriformis]|nr:hypothetical protein G9A89_006181 [Geosiphon pyriformis]
MNTNNAFEYFYFSTSSTKNVDNGKNPSTVEVSSLTPQSTQLPQPPQSQPIINTTIISSSSPTTKTTIPTQLTNQTITAEGGNSTVSPKVGNNTINLPNGGNQTVKPGNETTLAGKNDTNIEPSYRRDNEYPLDSASYMMGILFISTGLVSLFRGQRYKWITIYLGGFYATGLMILLFILKYQNVQNPSEGTRIIYFVLCVGAGLVSGAFFVCMWPTGRILVGAIGGLSLGLFLLSLRTNGLIQTQIPRYIFLGIFILIFTILSSFQRIYPYVTVLTTVFTGIYLIILGVDVFIRGGLLAAFKLFWGYTMWDDYKYDLSGETIVVLTSIGFIGGALGLGVQVFDLAVKGPNVDNNKITDDEEKVEGADDGETPVESTYTDILDDNEIEAINTQQPLWQSGRSIIKKTFKFSEHPFFGSKSSKGQ